MSHYDDSYEFDAREARKERCATFKEAIKRLDELKSDLPSSAPARFTEALEDLRNWLRANSAAD